MVEELNIRSWFVRLTARLMLWKCGGKWLTWQRTMKDDAIGDWLVPVDIIACTGASGRTFRPSHLEALWKAS